MNKPLLISIGVIIFLFIFLTVLLGPIGFFLMIILSVSFGAGYVYEMKQEGKNEKQ